MEKIVVNISWEDNYGTWIDILPGCVAAHEKLEGVKKLMKEAVAMHLESMKKYDEDIPIEFQGEYELVFKLNVKALLHRYKGVISNAGLERLTGINRKQLQHYYSGLRQPLPAQREKIERALHDFGKELMEVEL